MKATNLFQKLILILGLLFMAWILLSWADVVAHNVPFTEGYGQYQPWNFFTQEVIWG